MTYSIFALTDIGNTKMINQDSFFIRSTIVNKKSIIFGIVCDGIGGLSYGEFASAFVVQSFIKWFERYLTFPKPFNMEFKEIQKEWAEIIQDCNKKMIKFGERRNLQTGTTVNALLIKNNRYMVANIGDSRAYSVIKKMKRISKDHTILEQILEKEMSHHKMEKVADDRGQILTKCVGVFPEVEADYYFGRIKNYQALICCTDGFYRKMNAKDLEGLIHRMPLDKAIPLLIDSVKSQGETDNITVFAIKREKKMFQ